MRKGVSIFFALVIVLSAVHLNIAIHYCGGKIAATKVSLSGKLASCGMESTEESSPLPVSYLTTHCCDDFVTTIGILNNFTPRGSILIENSQNLVQIYHFQVNQTLYSNTVSDNLYINIRPPGKFLTTAVSLDDICVFRI